MSDSQYLYLLARDTFGYNVCRSKAIVNGRIADRIDITTGIPICYNPNCRSLLYTEKYRCNFCSCAFYCSLECTKYSNFKTCLFCFIADIGVRLEKNENLKLSFSSYGTSSI